MKAQSLALLLTILLANSSAMACPNDSSLKSQHLKLSVLNAELEIKKSLEVSYNKGEAGIEEIVSVLEEGLTHNYSPCYMDHIYHSTKYLLRYVKSGLKDDAIGCLLMRAFEKTPLLSNRVPSAEALNLITGKDVGFDQDFIENYSEADAAELNDMIMTWKSELTCE